MHNAERVISRDELLNEVWVTRTILPPARGQSHFEAAQKLEKDPANPVHFQRPRMGYKFVRDSAGRQPQQGELVMLKLRMRTKFSLHAADLRRLTCTSLLLVRHSVQKQSGGKSSPTCAIRRHLSDFSGNANLL